MAKPTRRNQVSTCNLLSSILVWGHFCGFSVCAKPTFTQSQIEGQGAELIFCDLDGDRLKDAVLIHGLNLSVYYQDVKRGYSQTPQQQFKPEERAFVVWSARLGKKAESLLIMNSDGVAELTFTNRTEPPARVDVIKERTIIPETLDQTEAMYVPLSAQTGTECPLLLVPAT